MKKANFIKFPKKLKMIQIINGNIQMKMKYKKFFLKNRVFKEFYIKFSDYFLF